MIKGDLISRSELLKHSYGGDYDGCGGFTREYVYVKDINNAPTVEVDELQKIKEITARALRSEDPINLYKARALDEIAEILGIELKAPAEESDNKDQITIDDII